MRFEEKYANVIREARNAQHLTQGQLAEMVRVSVRTIQKAEQGEKLPKTLTTLRILDVLDIPYAAIREELHKGYRYVPQRELLHDAAGQEYSAYGIIVEEFTQGEWKPIDFIRDIALTAREIGPLVVICNDTVNELAPEHIYDVIEDWLGV